MQKSPLDAALIPYEILRRSDGMMALSCRAGLLGNPPSTLVLLGDCAFLTDKDQEVMSRLAALPRDLVDNLKSNRSIRFYECLPTGIFAGHTLNVRLAS